MPVASAALTAGLTLVGLAVRAPAPAADTVAPLDVPFIAQGPLLCGGAAAAMVERYWAARGVYAADFARLVHPREGGIRAVDLAAALANRGYTVQSYENDPAVVPGAIEDGVPVIVLLDGGERSLHYVVVVGWDRRGVWIHDPAYGPARRLSHAELMRRWANADEWALVVRPGSDARSPAPPTEAVDTSSSPLVRQGIEALRRGEYDAGRRTALDILARDPGARIGWRLLATARYLDGAHAGALRAWNRIGEPRLDLVRITGLHHTRYVLVERMLGLRHGAVLTGPDLAVARRRLGSLPSLSMSRLDYQPLPDGSAEVTAAVLERSTWPTGRLSLATLAANAVLNRRAEIEVGPFLGAADRWTLTAQWEPAFAVRRFAVRALAPPLPGVVGVTVDWRRARFGSRDGSARVDERTHAGVDVEHWIGARLRLDGGLGLDRWGDGSRLGNASVGAAIRLAPAALRLRASAEGWAGGSTSFGRIALRLGARIARGEHREWRINAGAGATSSGAPLLTWWGAGTGRTGDILLRGHPLIRDDAVRGPAFGRTLLHASVEHVALWRVGPARAGGAVFLNAARAWRTAASNDTPLYADFGAGLRAEMGERGFRLDLARGGADWVLSAQAGYRIR